MTWNKQTKWIATAMVAALALTAIAPSAEAKSRKHRYKKARYEHRWDGHRRAPHRVVEIRRSSDGLPAFAFIGGLVLGSVLTHHAHASQYECAVPAYVYRDPYCDRSFATLEIYVTHLRQHRHPRVVYVIDPHSGNHLHTYRYYRGDWIDWNDEWDRDW
jgi:hypothetical protein